MNNIKVSALQLYNMYHLGADKYQDQPQIMQDKWNSFSQRLNKYLTKLQQTSNQQDEQVDSLQGLPVDYFTT